MQVLLRLPEYLWCRRQGPPGTALEQDSRRAKTGPQAVPVSTTQGKSNGPLNTSADDRADPVANLNYLPKSKQMDGRV
jgi:hypothetical protein